MFKLEFDKKAFLLVVLLSLLFFMPVFLSSHYYNDDLGRSIYGYTKWSENGRPLVDILFYLLSFGPLTPDISPLPQFLSLGILSFCVYLCAKTFLNGYNVVITVFISMVLITSPFLLENLSYKYDAFPMSISVLCALIPFTLKDATVKKLFLICSISVFLILCIYQASINTYIIFAILYVLMNFREKNTRKGLVSIIASVGGMLISYAIYSIFILPNFLVGSYNIRHSELATSGIKDAIAVISKNTDGFVTLMGLSATPAFMVFSLLAISLSIISLIKISATQCSSSAFEKTLKYIVVALSPFVVLFMIPGSMMLLRAPVLSPRVLLAFGAACFFFAVLSAWAFSESRKFRVVIGIMYIAYAIYSLGFTYAYANSLNNQEKYENAIIQLMISDMNGLNLNNEKFIAFLGRMPLSPETRMATKKYPLIGKLIQPTINNDSVWGHTQMLHFDLDKRFQSYDYHTSIKSKLCTYKLERKSNNYNVFVDQQGSTIVFDFTKTICK